MSLQSMSGELCILILLQIERAQQAEREAEALKLEVEAKLEINAYRVFAFRNLELQQLFMFTT